jgi:hypothetical protein
VGSSGELGSEGTEKTPALYQPMAYVKTCFLQGQAAQNVDIMDLGQAEQNCLLNVGI